MTAFYLCHLLRSWGAPSIAWTEKMTNHGLEWREFKDFTAKVVRSSRRKTAEIRVRAGAVSILVPALVSVKEIDKILEKKQRWIVEKIELQHQIIPPAAKKYVNGEVFSYLGDDYPLQVESGPYAPVELICGVLMVRVPGGSAQPSVVRNALLRWYKRRAHEQLEARVNRLAPLVGAQPTSIEVKTFKARWGSCSIKGKLQFNWLIILAPERIVDYVVVHELCHLLQHNHSAAYWREVARVMPDYRECRDWLKSNAAALKV